MAAFLLLMLQVFSPNEVRLHKTVVNNDPGLWAFEPGPLRVVGIDIGTGLVRVKPEEGGVVVAVVKPDISAVQDNKSLRIYQSTKQIEITGTGFEDLDVSVDGDVIGHGTMLSGMDHSV